MKVLISFTEDVVQELDELAEILKRTRTDLIRTAVGKYLEETKHLRMPTYIPTQSPES